MNESRNRRRRLDIALDLIQSISNKREFGGMNLVLLRTPEGKWKALFDRPDLREAGSKDRIEKIGAASSIEEALMTLIVNPE